MKVISASELDRILADDNNGALKAEIYSADIEDSDRILERVARGQTLHADEFYPYSESKLFQQSLLRCHGE